MREGSLCRHLGSCGKSWDEFYRLFRSVFVKVMKGYEMRPHMDKARTAGQSET